jgi:GR25 family glycosyltransferase involved in LPS biosynthesis
MQAYCINLARNPERRAAAQAEFEREGLDVAFFRATDGKAEAPKGLFITESEWGCADSHIRIWRDVVENGHEMALVFEDDISLVPNFTSKLQAVLSELPEDWDFVNLGTTPGFHNDYRRYSDNLVVGQALMAHAYLISHNCAKKWALWESKYLHNPIDVFFMYYPSNNFHVQVEKSLAVQNGDVSTIGGVFTRTFDWTFVMNRWGLLIAFLLFLFIVRRSIFE